MKQIPNLNVSRMLGIIAILIINYRSIRKHLVNVVMKIAIVHIIKLAMSKH